MGILLDTAMRGMPLEPTTVATVDSVVVATVLVLLVLIAFSAKHVRRLFKQFFNEVWLIRRHDNAYDENVTQESRTILLLMLLTSVLEGTIGAAFFVGPTAHEFLSGSFIGVGIAIVFNVFSIVACSVVGYTFTSPFMAIQWRRSLMATQAILGLMLVIPLIVVLSAPSEIFQGIILSVILYLIARILYIVKGIRIFYTGITSLLYFILYLCTLEIIPLLVIWRFAVSYYA